MIPNHCHSCARIPRGRVLSETPTPTVSEQINDGEQGASLRRKGRDATIANRQPSGAENSVHTASAELVAR